MQRTFNSALSITPAFRRRFGYGLAALAVLLIAGAGLRSFLGYYMNLPTVCGQPCLVTDPACAPLRLELELKDARARVRVTPRIWYRASVTNVSCGTRTVKEDFFHSWEYSAGDQESQEDFYFRITDKSGIELTTPAASIHNDGTIGIYQTTVPASNFSAIYVDAPVSIEGVEPYAIDETAYPAMRKRLNGLYLKIEPGETVIPLPTKYWPNRLKLFALQSKDYVGTGSAKVEVELNHRIAPEPPPGFRLLHRLVFLRPGRYEIRLAYNGKSFGSGHYRYQTLPRPIVRWLTWMHDWMELPSHHYSRDWHIHAESSPREILVAP